MRKIMLLSFLITSFLSVSAYAQPSIKFGEMKHDFGTVNQTDAVDHVFDFSNDGNEDLLIEKVVPS